MSQRHFTDELHWALISRVEHEEAALMEAEATLSMADARLTAVGAGIARIRASLSRWGLQTSVLPKASGSCRPSYMSAKEFGGLMNMSARSVRTKLDQEGQVGVHYHLEGRRYCVHVAEAELFFRQGVASRSSKDSPGSAEKDKPLIADEVTRFRARAALRKARAS